MGLPVESYQPSKGITVDRTKKSIRITGTLEMYGSEATRPRARSVQTAINTNWTARFPDGFEIHTNVTVQLRTGTTASSSATPILATKIAGPSNVTGRHGNRTMTLNANKPHAFTWTAAHEFGHIIGLDDRYSESAWSKISGKFGGKRTNTVQAGYAGNMMAAHGGVVESKNLKDLKTENAPSEYWINDDDYVRNWVNAHTNADIAKLSTTDKLAMFATLMGWWISEADLNAMVKICGAVTSKAEADTIRKKVDLKSFSSLGQRTTMRIAFGKMP